MEEKIRKFWNKYKKQTIIAVIVVLSLFKIYSVLSERVNLTPDKVYEINTLPNVCANTKAGGFSDQTANLDLSQIKKFVFSIAQT